MIGAGAVASTLAPALEKAGIVKFTQVYSRSARSARHLAERLDKAQAVTDVAEVAPDADIYLVALTDAAIAPVASAVVSRDDALWVHTSGGVGIDVLPGHRKGVLYPLQTFTQGRSVDVSQVPFFIEGSDADVVAVLEGIVRSLGAKHYAADSDIRRRLHAAAVMSANFATHLLWQAERILDSADIPLEVLKPLMAETLDKSFAMGPRQAQTGPARRGDSEVCNAHRSVLAPDQLAIYDILTKSISSEFN